MTLDNLLNIEITFFISFSISLLGVLVLTYTEEIDHNCQEIEMLVRKSAMKIGIILGKE